MSLSQCPYSSTVRKLPSCTCHRSCSCHRSFDPKMVILMVFLIHGNISLAICNTLVQMATVRSKWQHFRPSGSNGKIPVPMAIFYPLMAILLSQWQHSLLNGNTLVPMATSRQGASFLVHTSNSIQFSRGSRMRNGQMSDPGKWSPTHKCLLIWSNFHPCFVAKLVSQCVRLRFQPGVQSVWLSEFLGSFHSGSMRSFHMSVCRASRQNSMAFQCVLCDYSNANVRRMSVSFD